MATGSTGAAAIVTSGLDSTTATAGVSAVFRICERSGAGAGAFGSIGVGDELGVTIAAGAGALGAGTNSPLSWIFGCDPVWTLGRPKPSGGKIGCGAVLIKAAMAGLVADGEVCATGEPGVTNLGLAAGAASAWKV